MLQNKLLMLGLGMSVVNTATTIARMFRRMEFKGKVVVITGGSRGLGLVLARKFAKENAKLVLIARDTEELEVAEKELQDKGVEAHIIVCDVTVQKDVIAAIDSVIEQMGQIDVLINNAGVIQVGPMDSMTVDDFKTALDNHFWAPLYSALAVTPHMREKKSGRIVNISSIGGKISVPHLLPYTASKFALVGLSEGLRHELMQDNIFVTTVCPGLMRTGSHVNADFKGQHKLEYALFSTINSLPFISSGAEKAADEIINACRYGDAELIITTPAQFAAKFRALFPQATADTLGTISRFLPKSGGTGTDSKTGKQSQSEFSPSPLTYLADRAAVDNNEELNAPKNTEIKEASAEPA